MEFLLYKSFRPHFERIYELKPETHPKCKKNKLSELSNAQTTIQSINILATEEVVWNVTTASNSKHLGICVFAGQKISPCALCLTCKPAPFNDWLATAKPPDFIGGRGVCPLLKTYQLSRNCFSVHDSQLFPCHDHSAADNSKPAMAVFKSRSIV